MWAWASVRLSQTTWNTCFPMFVYLVVTGSVIATEGTKPRTMYIRFTQKRERWSDELWSWTTESVAESCSISDWQSWSRSICTATWCQWSNHWPAWPPSRQNIQLFAGGTRRAWWSGQPGESGRFQIVRKAGSQRFILLGSMKTLMLAPCVYGGFFVAIPIGWVSSAIFVTVALTRLPFLSSYHVLTLLPDRGGP